WLAADGHIKPFRGDMDDYARFVRQGGGPGPFTESRSQHRSGAALGGAASETFGRGRRVSRLARRSRPSAIKRVAAVLKALESPLLVELAEVAQNLAPVTGAERRHEL